MKKKLLSLLLAATMCFSLAACGGSNDGKEEKKNSDDFKVGVILIGDENEGYTYAHIKGIEEAMDALGLSKDQVVWKYSISEDADCEEAALDLVDSGCNVIFSNSYGHQSHMQKVAAEVPEVSFVAMTGDTAAQSGLDNFSNAFTKIFESRYVSGVVAGMKLAELEAAGQIPADSKDADGNIKIGYVGAYPYAEVKSGYTAFYLGVKSVVENVVMEVSFTNSWFDITKEGEAANALMARGCMVIGQHADSTGAPAAVQAAHESGKTVFSVGYNIDMMSVAPDVALTSATNNWAVYYTYAIKAAMDGEKIVTDWAEGYEEDAVQITDLNSICAEGTDAKVKEVEEQIKSGKLHVFDTTKFTVDGKNIDECVVDLTGNFETTDEGDKNAVWDGYFHESELRSAPSFALDIDGITLLN